MSNISVVKPSSMNQSPAKQGMIATKDHTASCYLVFDLLYHNSSLLSQHLNCHFSSSIGLISCRRSLLKSLGEVISWPGMDGEWPVHGEMFWSLRFGPSSPSRRSSSRRSSRSSSNSKLDLCNLAVWSGHHSYVNLCQWQRYVLGGEMFYKGFGLSWSACKFARDKLEKYIVS